MLTPPLPPPTSTPLPALTLPTADALLQPDSVGELLPVAMTQSLSAAGKALPRNGVCLRLGLLLPDPPAAPPPPPPPLLPEGLPLGLTVQLRDTLTLPLGLGQQEEEPGMLPVWLPVRDTRGLLALPPRGH